LFVAWIGLLSAEMVHTKLDTPATSAFLQAAALALVFVGYAVGWRHEIAGGLMAIVGTVAFFIVGHVTLATTVGLGAAALFAAPGVFYLLAWAFDKEPNKHLWRLL
jgi:hypothetical protein